MCLDYIMHNGDTQDLDNLARHVHNLLRDLRGSHTRNMSPRQDYNRLQTCSRDRSRRT